jgi:hypothetical protein
VPRGQNSREARRAQKRARREPDAFYEAVDADADEEVHKDKYDVRLRGGGVLLLLLAAAAATAAARAALLTRRVPVPLPTHTACG